MSASRKRHRLLRWLLPATAIFVLVLAVLVVTAFYSETIFRIAVDTARPLVPGELRYDAISGTLAGPVSIRGLDYHVANSHIAAERLSFDISPWALLAANVELENVRARGLAVTLPPPDPAAANGPPPRPQEILDALALPVGIAADDIDVTDFVLRSGNGESMLELDRFSAALDWTGEHVTIHRLAASGPTLTVNGELSLGIGNTAHDAGVDLQGNSMIAGIPVAAHVVMNGNPDRMTLSVTVTEPARASLVATVQELLDTPHWNGELDVDALRPATFDAALPAIPWSGEFRFEGDWQDTVVNGSAKGGWPPVDGIDLALDAKVNAERVQIDTLRARVAALDATVSASGELHYANELHYSANGTIDSISWPKVKTGALRDVRFDVSGNADRLHASLDAATGENPGGTLHVEGELALHPMHVDARVAANDVVLERNGTRISLAMLDGGITGAPEDYDAHAEARFHVNDLPPAALLLQAHGNRQQLAVELERLQWLGGGARGNVQLAWRDALAADAELRGQGFELARLDGVRGGQLTGAVGGHITAHADLAGEQPAISVGIVSLDGEIAGRELRGSGSLRFSDGRIATQGLSLAAGDALLRLEDAANGFDFRVDVPQLGFFHPGLGGQLQANGHFEGRLEAPTLTVQASGNDISWMSYSIAALEIDAAMIRGASRDSFLEVTAGNATLPAIHAGLVEFELRGVRGNHDLNLAIERAGRDEASDLRFAAKGGLDSESGDEMQWHGQVTQLRFEHPAAGAWQLSETGPFRISAGAAEIPSHCLDAAAGRVCIGPVRWTEKEWLASGSLDSLPIGIVAGWLPAGLDYSGDIDGGFQLSGGTDGVDGRAQFRLGAGGIRQASGEGATTLLGWESGIATANFDGRVANADLDISLVDGGRVRGSGRLDIPPEGAMTIDARMQGSIDNLQLVPSLVPELSRLQGKLTADLQVNGPLETPRIRGEVRLRDGSARILALGTDWEDLELTLTAEGREISATGHAGSGEGYIDIDLAGRDTGDGLAGTARLTGENFKAVSTPEINVNISPQLDMTLQGRDLYIDGEVLVPFARIEPRDLSTAVQPSNDEIIVNAEGAASKGMRVHVAVTTRLGDDVRVDALGLTARLDGRLAVTQEPGSPATGNGRLIIVEGKYESYGQDLTLAKGEIIYTGQPLANPGLDIRAERKIEPDITAGVAVRGPLSQPVANVYSDPLMTETEALSYLLFGRSIEQATSAQEGEVANAALALNLGGQKLLGNVGRKLGVEEFRVDTASDRDNPSLVLGKYLSPDLYISYGIGLFEAVNTFRVRYRMSSKWTLEATSGLRSSADIVYTIER